MKTTTLIFVSLWILAVTATAEPGLRHAVIEAAGPDMPRADTASVAELAGGTLMVVYQKYETSQLAGRGSR